MQQQRIRGLDSIRFVLAALVVLYHTPRFPLLLGIDESTALGNLVAKWYQSSVNGQAAVIAFFVISGFCIHYPFRKGDGPRLRQYYPRRLLRTVLPAAAMVGLSRAVHISMPVLAPSVLWSLVCEEIYYFLYPFVVRPLGRRVGWWPLILVGFALAEALTWGWPQNQGGYVAYSWKFMWLLGLPCWLLGCKLAEDSDQLLAPVSPRTIWAWRAVVFLLSGVCQHYLNKLAMTHTLNYFAVLVYCWLQQEIRYHRRVAPSKFLEWAGTWSYSLYLTHLTAYVLYDRWYHFPNLGHIPTWFMHRGWELSFALVFSLLVEKPAHLLARWLASRIGRVDRPGTPAEESQARPNLRVSTPDFGRRAAG